MTKSRRPTPPVRAEEGVADPAASPRNAELERIRATYAGYIDSGYQALWSGREGGMVLARAERDSWLVEAIRPMGDAVVVDLGCGDGNAASTLDRAGIRPSRYVGVDLLPARIAEASTAVPWGEFHVAPADEVPLATRSVDAVVAMTMLSSILDSSLRASVAIEVGRILRPGGLRHPHAKPAKSGVEARPCRGSREAIPRMATHLALDDSPPAPGADFYRGWTTAIQAHECAAPPALAHRRGTDKPGMTDRTVEVLLVGDLGSVHIRRLATTLADRGVHLEIATFDGEAIAGIAVHRLGVSGRPKTLRYLLAIPQLMRIIRRRRPRIVNAHYLSSFGLISAIGIGLGGRAGRPALIQTAWGTDLLVTAQESSIRRLLAGFALRRAAAITGDSVDLLEIAAHLAPHTPTHRFVFGPPTALLSVDDPPKKIVISTRRLDSDTRVDLVVAAFLEAARSHAAPMEGWRLIVAGDGAASSLVRRTAIGAPSVELVGHLEDPALRDLLATAHVAVSVPVSDATSASLLEALAAGLTVVVNDLPANREWVDSTTAEIVPRNPSIAELADAIARAVARPIERSTARAAVRDVTWEAQVTGLQALYAAVSRDVPR
jgi:glycosyltransferase involved in cell wall biosynthesis/SAM-dependent methyltransferase